MEKSYLRPFNGRVTVIASNPSPEVVAFAMSRFSRSADSMETSLDKVLEYAQDRHAKFFEENYHSYGHASIGDQAHVAFAVEDISMLAIFHLWQMLEIVDGQERSSRYQPFDKTGYSLFGSTKQEECLLSQNIDMAFETYSTVHQKTVDYFLEQYPDSRLFAEGGGLTREKLAQQLNRNPTAITDAVLAKANSTQADRLLFPHHNASWATAIAHLEESGPKLWQQILDEGGWHRESKEDFPRDGRGSELTIELVMDIGAARDYNRHRGCFKQYQWRNLGILGWGLLSETPNSAIGFFEIHDFMDSLYKTSKECDTPYPLPLATSIRAVYHMSWPQLIYMLELRSIPSGHPAYRWLTAQALEAINNVDPEMYHHLQTKLDEKLFRFTPYDAVKGKFFVR